MKFQKLTNHYLLLITTWNSIVTINHQVYMLKALHNLRRQR